MRNNIQLKDFFWNTSKIYNCLVIVFFYLLSKLIDIYSSFKLVYNFYILYASIGGEIYEGQYRDGKKDGYGELIDIDQERYSGEWVNGFRHGNGRYVKSNGNIITGTWVKNKLHGTANYFHNNGRVEIRQYLMGEWIKN